jgi:hypothetical protein
MLFFFDIEEGMKPRKAKLQANQSRGGMPQDIKVIHVHNMSGTNIIKNTIKI